MNSDYLPQLATLAEACEWLQACTGQPWPLVRLLEAPIQPHIWLKPDAQEPPNAAVMKRLFDGRHRGFLAPVAFADDTRGLAIERRGELSLTVGPTDEVFRFTPPVPFELDELRYKAEDLRRLAAYVMRGEPERDAKGKLVLQFGDVTVTADDLPFEQWLQLHGGIEKLEVLQFAALPEPLPDAKVAPSANASPVAQPEGDAWKHEAREIAKGLIAAANGRYFPSQEALAKLVADELRKRGTHGPSGAPLSAGTVKRHALKGITSGGANKLRHIAGQRGK